VERRYPIFRNITVHQEALLTADPSANWCSDIAPALPRLHSTLTSIAQLVGAKQLTQLADCGLGESIPSDWLAPWDRRRPFCFKRVA
jgi:hypothetical protein